MVGCSELHHPFGGLAVKIVEAAGIILVEDLAAHRVLDLERRHPPVEGSRNDDMKVFHSFIREHLDEDGEHGLADVRSHHLGQGKRDIIDRDRHPHPRLEQRGQGFHFFRVGEGVADCAFSISKCGNGRVRIHDTRTRRHLNPNHIRRGAALFSRWTTHSS